VTGAVAAVRDDDYIITAYRIMAHALARVPRGRLHGGAFRKRDGCSRGLVVHAFFDRKNHM